MADDAANRLPQRGAAGTLGLPLRVSVMGVKQVRSVKEVTFAPPLTGKVKEYRCRFAAMSP